MTIPEALTTASKEQGWNATRLAASAGVTEAAARAWLSGKSMPAGDKLEALRRTLPGLATLLDNGAVVHG